MKPDPHVQYGTYAKCTISTCFIYNITGLEIPAKRSRYALDSQPQMRRRSVKVSAAKEAYGHNVNTLIECHTSDQEGEAVLTKLLCRIKAKMNAEKIFSNNVELLLQLQNTSEGIK